ncbi:hypothetical protein QUB17_21235 [Microcoleus sp. B5-C4]
MLHYIFLTLTIIDLIIPDPMPALDELVLMYLTYITWLQEQKNSK